MPADPLVELIRSPRGRSAESGRRVLFVTNMWPEESRPWYGTFVHTQAGSLEALGIAVDVLYIRGYRTARAYARAVARALRLNAEADWDIVHAHYGHSGVAARFDLRHPLVVSYCGDDLLGTLGADERPTRKSRAEVAVFRRLAHVARLTITKSEAMERVLPPGCRADNRVIPNGVDLSRLEPQPRDEARARLGWPAEDRVVLFVANPELPVKNYPLAVAACERLRAEDPRVELRVAWGVPPAEIPTWMSAADALILTSRAEGSPNVVKEAMACALPVVATAVGDVPERLSGVAGCHAACHDPDDLAAGLRAALAHGRSPDARAAVEALSLDRVAKRVNAVYDEALARR